MTNTFHMKSLFPLTVLLLICSTLFSQPTIVSVSGSAASCSNNGTATVTISGGTPVFCFQINGGNCQYWAGNTYTFSGLFSGTYTITVSDNSGQVSETVTVGGNYSEPVAFATLNGCGVLATSSGGLPPYQYAISMNGGPFSPPGGSPAFSPVTGSYCVRVYDACNNFTQYCGFVNVPPINFQAICCNGNASGGQLCVNIQDPNGHTIWDPGFWIGGAPPYTFSATSNGQTVTDPNGLFNLNPACPGWEFTVTDACGNSVSQTANCSEVELLCVDCSAGTAQVQGSHGAAPYTYQFQEPSGNWINNPGGANSGNFSGLPAFPNGTGVAYAFQVVDACGNVSETLWATCLDAAATYNCGTGQAALTSQTDYFPATVTCNTCTPMQSFVLQEGEQAVFTGLSGMDEYTISDACGATITKHCEEVEPIVNIQRSCNALQATMLSQYTCDWMNPLPVSVDLGVTYTLYLASDPTNPIATNGTGSFDGLVPGATYLVEATHLDCGMAAETTTLFNNGDFTIQYEVSITSFLENGVCKKGYNLMPFLVPDPDLPPQWDMSGGTFQTPDIGIFENLVAGNWSLEVLNYCTQTFVNLPDWQAEIDIQLPECPNGSCVELSGIRNQQAWMDWGAANGLAITNPGDYYLLDCTDLTAVGCQGSWTDEFCNIVPGTDHTVYLMTALGECPIDMAEFNMDLGGAAKLDSVALTTAVACAVNGLGSLTAEVFGGKDPLYLEVLDNITGQVLQTIPDANGDHFFEINNLLAGKDYLFRIVDDCGNSTDALASIISLPDVEAEFSYQCQSGLTLFTDAIYGAEYTWRRQDGSLIDAGLNLFSVQIPAPNAAEAISVEIIFANCPPHITTVDVPYFPSASVDFSFVDTMICSAAPFSLPANTGLGNYTFEWADGTQANEVTVSQSGTYSVTATNDFGCVDSALAIVTLSPPIVLDFEKTDPLCFGNADGTATVTPVGGSQPYNYQWSNGADTPTINGLTTGAYTVILRDNEGCEVTDSVEIFVPPLLLLETTASQLMCSGDEDGLVQTDVHGGTQPYIFSWENGAATPSIDLLTAGEYAVTVADANGCLVSDTALVEAPNGLTVVLEKTDVLCFGENTGAVQAMTDGGVLPHQFFWSNGETTADLNGLFANGYSVIVTDANGCSLEKSIAISQPTELTASSESTDVNCKGFADGTITTTAGGGTEPYIWSSLPNIGNGQNLAPTDYTLTVTDANGCSVELAETITEPPLLTLSVIGDNIPCHGQPDGIAEVVASGGTAPYDYNWSNGAIAPQVDQLTAGHYGVIVSDAKGCTETGSVEITAPPLLEVSYSATDILCFGETSQVEIMATGGTIPYIGTGQLDLSAGDHFYLVQDDYGCLDSVSFTITQPDLLVVSDIETGLAGCDAESNGTIEMVVEGGILPYQFLWQNGQTAHPMANLPEGTYPVEITDANGCTVTASSDVEDLPPLSFAVAIKDASCFGEIDGTIEILEISGGAAAPYFMEGNAVQAGYLLNHLPANFYTLVISDSYGCTVEKMVEVDQPPFFQIQLPEELYVPLGETIHLDPTVFGVLLDPLVWNWWPEHGLDCTDCPDVEALPLQSIEYHAFVEDANGCTAADTVSIRLDKRCELFVPNAFSPNGDGINDLHYPFAPPCVMQIEHWAVFDRWGNLVFEQNSFPPNDPNFGWGGSFNNNIMNPGVFIWMAEATLLDGRKVLYKGEMVLMK